MGSILAEVLGWVGKAIAFPFLVLLVAVFLWLPSLLIQLLPLPTRIRVRWSWALRRGFWNLLATAKFRRYKPMKIPVPADLTWPRWILANIFGKRLDHIERVPFKAIFPKIPIPNIMVAAYEIVVAAHEPGDEWDWKFKVFTWVQVMLYWLFPPMQEGLPSIDSDPYEALRQAYGKRHRKLFPPPVMPLELQGSPDLGALAVKGPYACYLKQYQSSQDDPEWEFEHIKSADKSGDLYIWDFFRDLATHEHHDGVYNLGVAVLFMVDRALGTVKPVRIKSELGISKPDDNTWEFAKKLALCAATNHLSLVRHFNGVHLAAGAHIAIATRNCLPLDHPLCRLLWPYIFRTQQSNRAVTLAQMEEGGDFESIFSFTRHGMCQLFEETHNQYEFVVNDPERDAHARGIAGGGFDTPTQKDQQEVFKLMFNHARDYIRCYPTNVIAGPEVQAWIDNLELWIPRGITAVLGAPPVTPHNVARVIACIMYMVTVQHEILGEFLWNYQLWAHKQPPRLYRDGRRVPLDVYQRLVNANFNFNVTRNALMRDYSYLALPASYPAYPALPGTDPKGTLMAFQTNLAALEATWRGDPWSVWRVYPRLLEVSINA